MKRCSCASCLQVCTGNLGIWHVLWLSSVKSTASWKQGHCVTHIYRQRYKVVLTILCQFCWYQLEKEAKRTYNKNMPIPVPSSDRRKVCHLQHWEVQRTRKYPTWSHPTASHNDAFHLRLNMNTKSTLWWHLVRGKSTSWSDLYNVSHNQLTSTCSQTSKCKFLWNNWETSSHHAYMHISALAS